MAIDPPDAAVSHEEDALARRVHSGGERMDASATGHLTDLARGKFRHKKLGGSGSVGSKEDLGAIRRKGTCQKVGRVINGGVIRHLVDDRSRCSVPEPGVFRRRI